MYALYKKFLASAASHVKRVPPACIFIAGTGNCSGWLYLLAFENRGEVMLHRLIHRGHRYVVRQRVTLDS